MIVVTDIELALFMIVVTDIEFMTITLRRKPAMMSYLNTVVGQNAKFRKIKGFQRNTFAMKLQLQ